MAHDMSGPADPDRSKKIGDNIAAIRRRRGLTLDGLAELSLVSRAAISALEKGDGNPRVQTLWNLADALGVDFGTLLGDGADEHVTDEGGLAVRLIERQSSPKRVEAFVMEVPAGQARHAKPHVAGVREHVLVLAGEMRVGPSDGPSLLGAGQSLSFAADVPHVYAAGQDGCRAIVTVVYPEMAAGAVSDHELAWPSSRADWDGVLAILGRAAIEVQNGLGVSLTTVRSGEQDGRDRAAATLLKRVATMPMSPAVRRFVTSDPDPTVITLYRTPQMSTLGPRPETLKGPLAEGCWPLAEMAVAPAGNADFEALGLLATEPGPVVRASLAAEVLTRAGRPTVPFGVGACSGVCEPTANAAYELVHPAYARQTLAVAAALPETEGLRILDVGTGPGLPLAMLRDLRPDLCALAVEPSDVAVKHLKKMRFADDPAVEVRQCSVTDLVAPPEDFPCAVSIGASHHLDTVAFFTAIRGQLAGGGRLIVADELIAPFHTREERQAALIRHHLWYILDTLVALPKDADPADRAVARRLANDIPKISAMAHSGKVGPAVHLLRRLSEEIAQIDLPARPSHPLGAFVRFHILELQALLAGLDYEVEQKTFPHRLISLARPCGFELLDHCRIYATDGDGAFDAGTHLFVFGVS